MKKLVLLIGLVVLTTVIFASIHTDNIRYMRKKINATQNFEALVDAYFDSIRIDGITIPYTAAQKDSLRKAANNWMDTIRIYSDSLEDYNTK